MASLGEDERVLETLMSKLLRAGLKRMKSQDGSTEEEVKWGTDPLETKTTSVSCTSKCPVISNADVYIKNSKLKVTEQLNKEHVRVVDRKRKAAY